jgi:magnesium-dependent phosphatase 1
MFVFGAQRLQCCILSRTLFSLTKTAILLSCICFARSGNIGAKMNVSKTCRFPKLVAFDLDGTIWSPDMYQLWGGGAPFTAIGDGTQQLRDSAGQKVRLLGVAGKLLEELKTDEQWKDTKVAWVSCTDEPSWAEECLRKFKTPSGIPIGDCIDSSQIYKANKQAHFQR